MNKNLTLLISNTLIKSIGGSIVTAFGVIFFYEQFGNSITNVFVLYGFLYICFSIVTHFGSKFIHKIGMKNMMIIATIFLVGMYLSRVFWENNQILYLSLFILFFILYKMFYWVPYHVEFAAFTIKGKRGAQVAVITNAAQIVSIIIPAISGYVLLQYGYDTIFFIASLFTFLSIIPLLFLKQTEEKYEWSLKRFVKEIFQKENRSIVIGNFSLGMEDAVASVTWPIFIFIILSGDYVSVGIVISLVAITLMIIRTVFGKITDRIGNKKALMYGSFFHITGWISKMFVNSGAGLYFIDTYSKFCREMNLIPFRSSVYDEAELNEHYIDEYTVLRETSFLLGKSFMCILSIFIVALVGIKATFVIAALAVLPMSLVAREVKID